MQSGTASQTLNCPKTTAAAAAVVRAISEADTLVPLVAAVREHPAAALPVLEAKIRAEVLVEGTDSLRVVDTLATRLSRRSMQQQQQQQQQQPILAEAAIAAGAQEQLFSLVITMQKAVAATSSHRLSLAVAAGIHTLCMLLDALGDPLQLLLQARSTVLLSKLLLQQMSGKRSNSRQQQQQQQQQQGYQVDVVPTWYISTEMLKLHFSGALEACKVLMQGLGPRLAQLQLPGHPDAAAAAKQELQQQHERLAQALLPDIEAF
jgi:hypothetical protein